MLVLAILSLAILSWDYTCGHTFEDMISLEYCPFCQSFQSAEIGVLLVFILVLLGFVSVIGRLVVSSNSLLPLFCVFSVIPNRAPPVCC